MGPAEKLIAQLDSLALVVTDSSGERAEKVSRRRHLAEQLCEAIESAELDAPTGHAAARVLMGVQAGDTAFVERAQQLARRSWAAGHPQGGALYARATDLLCNRRREPQKYGTLVYVRQGEQVLQALDDVTTDDERAALGLEPLASLREAISRDNRRAAEELGRTTGLPPGAEVRRVWRDEAVNDLLRRRDAAGGPVWREGEELVFVWENDADEVSLTAGIQMALWRLDGSDVWVLRARIRDIARAIVSHGFLGTAGGSVRFLGGDGCWRGDQAPPAPAASSPLAGAVSETELRGPDGDHPRRITVYRPPTFQYNVEHPVVYLADGHITPSLAAVLDAAIQNGRVPPTVLVGVASGGQDGDDIRNDEYLPGRHPERFESHRVFFTETVATWAQREHGASPDVRRRAVFGVSSGATFAVTMGLRHPDRFSRVLAFSLGVVPVVPWSWPEGNAPAHYLAAGTLEEGFRKATASWAAAVGRAGGECVHVERVSGHDYRMWEREFVEAVAWAFA